MLPELGRNGTWRRSPDSRGWESSSEWRLEIDWPTPAQIGRGAIVALVLLVAVASPAHGAPYAIGLQSTTVGGIDPGAGLVAARRSGYSDATLLDHVVDGPSVTISIPRELIGSPEAFNFAMSATGDGSAEWDRSPDEENACHSIGFRDGEGH